MPSNGSSAHTQPEYSVVVVAVAAGAAAAVVVGATAAAVFSHATLSFKCPCVRYNAARTQPGHFTCHFPRLHPVPPPPPPPFHCLPCSTAAVDFNGCSVARRESQQRCSRTQPPHASLLPPLVVVPRLAACIRDGIASCFHVAVVVVACLVAILISPAAQRRIF